MPVGGNALMTPNSIKLHLSRNLRTICGLWLRIDAKKPAPHAPATQHKRGAPTQETEVARARFRQRKQSAPLQAARTGHRARHSPTKPSRRLEHLHGVLLDDAPCRGDIPAAEQIHMDEQR
ncbi:MAG TPA: hypothetical protein VKP30_06935, partial [Polyangiaceae bacterium]|nr:hypothetical protein [Polyangiaceae bacterium]